MFRYVIEKKMAYGNNRTDHVNKVGVFVTHLCAFTFWRTAF